MASTNACIETFRGYLQRRNYASHTVESYGLDLQVFFADCTPTPATVTYQDVECFVERQHTQNLAPTTINRRLYALKHFFDFLLEHRMVLGNPVKPSHFAREGRPLSSLTTSNEAPHDHVLSKGPADHAL